MLVNAITRYTLDATDHYDRLYSKEYLVGSDVYFLEELDRAYIEKLKFSDDVDEKTKKMLWNIEFDSENNIILRAPLARELKRMDKGLSDFKLIEELKAQNVTDENIRKMYKNKSIYYLPYAQKCTKRNLTEKNLFLNAEEIEAMGYKEGDYVYKLKKIKKHFRVQLKGISNQSSVVYFNYATNEICT